MTDWNIPKHLATFTFTTLPNNTLSISVLPHGSTKPFFTATFRPMSYTPSFPLSTSIAKYIGLDLELVQPPLPEGKGEHESGTQRWCRIMPFESGKGRDWIVCLLK